MKYIPYSRQEVREDDIREVAKTLRSPLLTQGPKVAEFEQALAGYSGARYCVAFSSGTAALHAAYFAAGIGKGDEVILPALTFAATANAALYLGAKPRFADIDERTGNIDSVSAASKITKKTKALVAVDFAGLPADLAALGRLARTHKLVFIEDAAQALGARYRNKKVGAIADMTVFSFHPVKSITTGEGGAVVTNNKKYYELLCMFRSHGLTRDPKRMKQKQYANWHQEMHLLGYNYRLTDIQAALGVSQMRKLERFVTQRRGHAMRYQKLLQDEPGIMLPPQDKNSAWHLFVVRVLSKRKGARDAVFTKLRAAGIGVQVHYLPVYLHPYYQKLGYAKHLCPKAEAFSFSALSLPLFPSLSRAEQDYVVHTLREVLHEAA